MNQPPKPGLLMLSDLWGKEKSQWLTAYLELLTSHFEIDFKDCCELGKVNTDTQDEHKIHQHFVNGGVSQAVDQLINESKTYEAILGVSIGGLIGWKALLTGLDARKLYAVSSTRLRYEVVKPNCPNSLFFGENDPYKPSTDWYQQMELEPTILEGQDHEMYHQLDVTKIVCAQLIADLS